ncbi:MAG: radical SAM protein [Vulcanimicrobiota bacterium]
MTSLTLHYPQNTLPVSVTGSNCSLNCKHCRGYYLKSMKTLKDVEIPAHIPENITSFLISGGSTTQGKVPILNHLSLLQKLKQKGYRLNLHTGLAGHKEAGRLAELADVVSLDFPGDEAAIKEVYGLNKKPEDYIRVFKYLSEFTRVAPHLTLGLNRGKICGEFSALEALASLNAEKIIFLVIIPTPHTPFYNIKPPSLKKIEKVLDFARQILPMAKFGLGCMHPRGRYKKELEKIALKFNFTSIVNPSRELVDLFNNENIKYKIDRECCSFC